MKNLRIPLRIVFYKEVDDWVAHCLEFNLMGDGATREEALDQLTECVLLQVQASMEHNNPRNLFTPADGKYFAMYAAGKDAAVGELHIKIDSVEVNGESREYVESETGLTCV